MAWRGPTAATGLKLCPFLAIRTPGKKSNLRDEKAIGWPRGCWLASVLPRKAVLGKGAKLWCREQTPAESHSPPPHTSLHEEPVPSCHLIGSVCGTPSQKAGSLWLRGGGEKKAHPVSFVPHPLLLPKHLLCASTEGVIRTVSSHKRGACAKQVGV